MKSKEPGSTAEVEYRALLNLNQHIRWDATLALYLTPYMAGRSQIWPVGLSCPRR